MNNKKSTDKRPAINMKFTNKAVFNQIKQLEAEALSKSKAPKQVLRQNALISGYKSIIEGKRNVSALDTQLTEILKLLNMIVYLQDSSRDFSTTILNYLISSQTSKINFDNLRAADPDVDDMTLFKKWVGENKEWLKQDPKNMSFQMSGTLEKQKKALQEIADDMREEK